MNKIIKFPVRAEYYDNFGKINGLIVEFTDLRTGTVIDKGNSLWKNGYKSNKWGGVDNSHFWKILNQKKRRFFPIEVKFTDKTKIVERSETLKT